MPEVGHVPRDRFIPQRSYSGNTTSKFHVRKTPAELTAHEKLLRQRERGENPFARRRRTCVSRVHLDNENILQPPHLSPHLLDSEANPRQFSTSGQRVTPRQVSVGAVWNVGGSSIATRGPWLGIVEGRRMYLERNVTAPLYIARYWTDRNILSSEEIEINNSRLAAAFDMDLAHRQLLIPKPASAEIRLCASLLHFEKTVPLAWEDCTWKRANIEADTRRDLIRKRSSAIGVPFRTLVMRPPIIDDFYHSVLAYCHSSGLIAYAVLDAIVLWSTRTCKKVKTFLPGYPYDCVTAVAFSSSSGGESILAVATCSGYLHLWDTVKLRRRFAWRYNDNKATCVAFRPTTSWCQSAVIPGAEVPVEQLAVGDQQGTIWYYSIELSPFEALSRVTLLARVDAHLARVCSITWSPDKRFLATSGDDNLCLLFEMRHILQNQRSLNTATSSRLSQSRLSAIVSQVARMLRIGRIVPSYSLSRSQLLEDSHASSTSGNVRSVSMDADEANITNRRVRGGAQSVSQARPRSISRFQRYRRVASTYYSPGLGDYGQTALHFLHGNHVHRFGHNSAVKAVAFAPWQPTLLATGGGMSDRTVHFYHAPTGSCLAKIYVWSQVTGLVWSKTRREIAVVLGFGEFEQGNQYRVVVFAWPSCQQVTAIPWNPQVDEDSIEYINIADRALSVISIPHFADPSHKRPGDVDGNPEDECIVIASPRYIRFYRIWAKPHKVFAGSAGVMRSEILEALDGIEDPRDEVIR